MSLFTTDKDGRKITVMDTAWENTAADFALLFDKPLEDFADYWSKGWVKVAIRKRLREQLKAAFASPDFDESDWYSVADNLICGCWHNGRRKFVNCEYEMPFYVHVADDEVGITFGGPCLVTISYADVEMGD